MCAWLILISIFSINIRIREHVEQDLMDSNDIFITDKLHLQEGIWQLSFCYIRMSNFKPICNLKTFPHSYESSHYLCAHSSDKMITILWSAIILRSYVVYWSSIWQIWFARLLFALLCLVAMRIIIASVRKFASLKTYLMFFQDTIVKEKNSPFFLFVGNNKNDNWITFW